MAPNSRGLGYLIAELIRREARERGARAQLLQTLAAVPPEGREA